MIDKPHEGIYTFMDCPDRKSHPSTHYHVCDRDDAKGIGASMQQPVMNAQEVINDD